MRGVDESPMTREVNDWALFHHDLVLHRLVVVADRKIRQLGLDFGGTVLLQRILKDTLAYL